MSKPIIAIVGRPNVGKSTLFNKLIGERRAIVEDTPGVTRDRIYGETEWRGRQMVVIDTGGIEPKTDDIILSQMKVQAQIAIEDADVIIFLCDVRTGLTAADRDIAVMLQRSGKPIIPAINSGLAWLPLFSPDTSTCVVAVASGKGYLPCISLTKYLRKGIRNRIPSTPPSSELINTCIKLTVISGYLT